PVRSSYLTSLLHLHNIAPTITQLFFHGDSSIKTHMTAIMLFSSTVASSHQNYFHAIMKNRFVITNRVNHVRIASCTPAAFISPAPQSLARLAGGHHRAHLSISRSRRPYSVRTVVTV